MPFLVGEFGLPLLHKNRLAYTAQQQAKPDTLHTMIFDNCLIYAGYKKNETSISDKILSLADDCGMFMGKMFDSHDNKPAFFNTLDSQVIVNDPAIVLKNWWGRYVGALYDKKNKQCTLIRDPQGLFSLFYIIKPDSVIFASEINILYDLLEEKPSIDLTYFAEYVVGENYASALTPFNEIRELLPGTGLTIHHNGTNSIKTLWDLSACKGSYITHEKDFEEELLATLKSSTKAWVGESSGVCLELSGGLDSSAVMILLREVLSESKTIIGVNYIDSKTPSSNEIEHAKNVADTCNASLHYIDWQDASLLDPLPDSWRPDKPSTFLLFHQTSQQLSDLAAQYNCSEIMNGQGGDHVFLAPQPVECLADYWLDKGFTGITHPLNELSSANRMPWWELVSPMVKNILHYYGVRKKKPRTKIESTETPFFDSNFNYTYKKHAFYLEKNLKNFYPAKISHVESLFHAVSFADRNQRIFGQTITHPLLSQPIIELALKIPTYQSFNNGFDRIFFRKAVSSIKNPQSLWRTVKGETTSSMAKSFAHHASIVHDILLNGRLSKEGFINKEWLNEQMAKIRHGNIENLWPITRLLTAQLWLNQWKL